MKKIGTKILIYGAGAVGQWLGGLLTRAGYDVSIITRFEFYDALKNKYLELQKATGPEFFRNMKVYPTLDRLPHPEQKFDWIFLTVKNYDVQKSLKDLRYKLMGDVKVATFQCGLGSDDYVSKIVGEKNVVTCCVTTNVAIVQPGQLMEDDVGGGICLAPLSMGASMGDLPKIFENSGIRIQTFKQYRTMRWNSILFDMVCNATGAILDYPHERIFEFEKIYELEVKAFEEALAVIEKLGIEVQDLPGYPVTKIKFLFLSLPKFLKNIYGIKQLMKLKKGRMPCLRIDMEKGKNVSEVEFLNGTIVRTAKKMKVAAPVNGFIYDALNRIVEGKIYWEKYKRKIDSFLNDYKLYMTRVK